LCRATMTSTAMCCSAGDVAAAKGRMASKPPSSHTCFTVGTNPCDYAWYCSL
jgi:hypothetical protein